jgi:hypothetical protein
LTFFCRKRKKKFLLNTIQFSIDPTVDFICQELKQLTENLSMLSRSSGQNLLYSAIQAIPTPVPDPVQAPAFPTLTMTATAATAAIVAAVVAATTGRVELT